MMQRKKTIYKEFKIETMFIIMFCILGLLYTVSIPPFRMTDEYRHFVRAYEISQGQIISAEKSTESLQQLAGQATWKIWRDDPDITVREEWVKDSSIPSSYSPFSYFVSSILLFFAGLCTDKVLVLIYVARLGQLATVALLLYPVIKNISSAGNLFILIGLMPMCMQEFAVLSGDSMAIALTMDVIAFVLWQREAGEGSMGWNEILAMIVMAFFLGQCKYIYVFVCLLYFFIPKKRFGGIWRKGIVAVAVGVCAGVPMLGWLLKVGSIGGAPRSVAGGSTFTLPEIVVRSLLANAKLYVASSAADGFGDLDIHPGIYWTVIILLLLFYVGILEDKKELKLSVGLRLGMLGTAVISVFMLFYTFIGGTNPETGVTNGLQGRYFIPMYLPVLLGISIPSRKIKFPEIPQKYFVIVMAIIDAGIAGLIMKCCIA